MEHRQLAGEPEDEVEAAREHGKQVREYEDGKREIAMNHERQRDDRHARDQELRHGPHFLPAKRPAGLNNRIATRKMRPYASRNADGRNIEPVPSVTPRSAPPNNDPSTLPIPASLAASIAFMMDTLPVVR